MPELEPLEETIEQTIRRHRVNAVYKIEIEDGRVWFSGANANLGTLVERVRGDLTEQGLRVEAPESDGVHAAHHGGVYLPIGDTAE